MVEPSVITMREKNAFDYLLSEIPDGFTLSPAQTTTLNMVRAFQDSDFQFQGIPLSFTTLVAIFSQIVTGRIGPKKPQLLRAFLDKLLARFHPFYWRCRFGKPCNIQHIPQNGLLIDICTAMPKNWNLISGALPMLEDLPLWIVLGGHSIPEHVRQTKIPVVSECLTMPGAVLSSWNEINIQWLQWRSKISLILREQHFHPSTEAFILRTMAQSVLIAAEISALLDATKPKLIIVDHDHQVYASLLVSLARIRSIPTITLQHGTLGALIGYVPLWADYALLWGELYARVFRAFGTDESRIRLVGCPRLHRTIEQKETVWKRHLKKRGIPFSDILVFLTPENGPDDVRRRLAKVVWEGMGSLSAHRLIIKCHPAETKHLYQNIFADEPRILIFSADEMSLEEGMSLADVVIAQYSGVATDALVMWRPVILINLDDKLSANQKMADMGATLVARSASELQSILEKRYDRNLNPSLSIAAERYVDECFVAFGDDASKLTAEAIRDIWNQSE